MNYTFPPAQGALFSDSHITQEYIRRYGRTKRVQKWENKWVHIQTENGVWRQGGCGYTEPNSDDAWVLPFNVAVAKIDHCGPEKKGRFLLANRPANT